MRHSSKRRRKRKCKSPVYLILCLAILGLVAWLRVAFLVLFGDSTARAAVPFTTTAPSIRLLTVPQLWNSGHHEIHCQITTDVRGNLGPPSVMLQNGTDWIHDRWQAASNMHGKQITGSHWVDLQWLSSSHNNNKQPVQVHLSKVILDWEAAYSDHYELLVFDRNNETNRTVFTAPRDDINVTTFGQSPGVKIPTPLHVVHSFALYADTHRVRLLIHKTGPHGWGVSLWQIQLYGWVVVVDDEEAATG